MAVQRKPVSAERAASMAAASKRYRARKTAERYGVAIPAAVAVKRLAMYHPPKAVPGASLAAIKRSKKVASVQAGQAAAARASAKATSARAARAAAVGKFPQARNPGAKIFTPRPVDRAVAVGARADAIRGRENASKVRAVGKRIKDEFKTGDYGDVADKLDPEELARFRKALKQMAKASDQAVGIFNTYEGGASDLGSIVSALHYPAPGGSVDEALTRLEVMADAVTKADTLYGPKAVGRIDV